ncbi:MAG: NUDIX hydrolase [Bifidobacteriaceae bacterium]|jgi:ADP-ribose pyrophosphatase|nr:NUDIX hydrolase [Bifidobacteriaceae bacterium]
MSAVVIRDLPAERAIVSRQVLARGRIQDFVAETVDLGRAGTVVREFVDHPGAVGVMAMDDAGRILLQRQYRHPVRAELWEPPAGLLDVAGEDPLTAAKRELAEEADLVAGDWRTLVRFCTTPGGCNERIAVFLARELTSVAADAAFIRQDEEVDLVPAWLRVDEAADLVLSGALSSPTAIVGILALAHAATQPGGWDALPPA